MEFLSELLANPYVLWIGGALLLAVLYQWLAPRLRIRMPGGKVSKDDLLTKILGPRYAEAKLAKEIARQKNAGNYLAAGKMLEDSGKVNEAVAAYLEGNEFNAAAGSLERLGRTERAAEAYLQAGDFKKAAQMFTDAGKPARAAALFQERGNNLEAARLYALAGAFDQAAELYARSGYPLRAAEAFEKMGEFRKAAECLEKHFMENVSFSTTYSSTAPSADQKSALQAGRLYARAGDLPRALQIYARGGYFQEAAQTSVALKQYGKAAEFFLRAEDPGNAAQAYEQAGDPVQAAILRGEVALKADRIPEAAASFQKGKDYLRAAELFESIGMLAEAAAAYEEGDSFAAAGSVYIRAGLKERAASSYERAGEFETAAKLYEGAGHGPKAAELYDAAGLTFKSGEAAAKAGQRDKAVALLQRVSSSDENYRPATELLSKLFIESGKPGLAVERLQKVIGGQPISPPTVDLYYWLAAGHDALGHRDEALDLYKKILSEDFGYRDVEARLARLESGAPPASVAAPAPAAVPAAPAAPVAPGVAERPSRRAGDIPPGTGPAAAPLPATTPAPGAPGAAPRASRFVGKEEVGRGPLGAVFRGQDQVDGRSVALRALPPEVLRSDGLLKGLVGDLKAASQLSHPNIVKVLGLVEVGGQRCIVSELVAGRNLAEALKAGHKMSFSQAHSLGRVLTQALSFIHGKGIVHGSIKPSNIMVSSGVVKVADLGLGRLHHAVIKDSEYRAPEGHFDVPGDIYATASVLYHLLTGVNPRSQPQGVALPLPSKLAPGVPEAFDKLLVRCLHPRPELRFGSAEQVLRELKDMVHIG